MTQATISRFFKGTHEEVQQSSDSEIEECGVAKNVKYYQTMLRKQQEIKKNTKLVTQPNSVAECWRYFGSLYISNRKILSKIKFCQICFVSEQTTLKGYASTTSTTNYTNHLIRYHNLDLKSVTYKKTAGLTKKSLTTAAKPNNFIHARRLCEMCCIDLQPFSIVERPGFQKYIKTLSPGVQFPTSTTIATSALNDVYDFYFKNVKNLLAKCPNDITLVLDMWTDKFKRISYINIKVHYSEEFDLKCISLKTEHFPHPHTGKLIATKISETLAIFNLQDRKLRAVTDAGSNILSALKLNKIARYPCIAHALHRFLVHDLLNNPSFEVLSNTIMKLKKIFKSLAYKGEELQKLQRLKQQENVYDIIINIQTICNNIDSEDNFPTVYQEMDLEAALKYPQLKSLKNSIDTRWNSILNMIDSFTQNFDIINLLLLNVKKENLIISDMEQEIIKEFGVFLQVFSEATTYLQGQEYATVSTCIYFFESIYAKLVENSELAAFGQIIHLYNYAKENFYKRFKILKIHALAALMDPCQKNWSKLEIYLKRIPDEENLPDDFILQLDVENPITKEKFILQEIRNRQIDEITPSCNNSVNDAPARKEKISKTRKKMLEFVSSSGNSRMDSITKEIQNYFSTDVNESESLDWWKENKKVKTKHAPSETSTNNIFPRIAVLANMCFSIPATSASSEMAFSTAGSCIAEKRSRLNPSTVKKQLFIHDNFKMVTSGN